jgi:hypothetical protein
VIRCAGCNKQLKDSLLCRDCMASESSGHAERLLSILERHAGGR